jgi:acetylornithine deacetylase
MDSNSARAILARLVAFDTVSDKTNLPLLAFVREHLASHGIASRLLPSEDATKANLFATIGPADVGGIGLSGHTDVVPVAGQAWDSDPFRLTEKDERLYGRGTCDMKGYLACVLAAVPEFKKRKLREPIHILFSYDEEVGCTGVRPMLAELGRSLPLPRIVIVGEPTSMSVVDTHKGPVRWQVEVTGRAAHSAMAPLGVNAITYAGRLLGELERVEEDLKIAPRDERFTPPYTTLQVTRIEGGTASNIVPSACSFGWEIRALPGLDTVAIEERLRAFAAERCLPEMRGVAPGGGIVIRRTNEVAAFAAGPGSDAVALARTLTRRTGLSAVSFATEAGLFQVAGAPAVICGPGDIAQAHTANEWLATDQLNACVDFMARLADWAET